MNIKYLNLDFETKLVRSDMSLLRYDSFKTNLDFQSFTDFGGINFHNSSCHYVVKFNGRLVSRRGDTPWPPRSLDFATVDFFFCDCVRHKIWDVSPA